MSIGFEVAREKRKQEGLKGEVDDVLPPKTATVASSARSAGAAQGKLRPFGPSCSIDRDDRDQAADLWVSCRRACRSASARRSSPCPSGASSRESTRTGISPCRADDRWRADRR